MSTRKEEIKLEKVPRSVSIGNTTEAGLLEARQQRGNGAGSLNSIRQRRGNSNFNLRRAVPEEPVDEEVSFFSKGRDFASVYTNHKYTKKEREILAAYDSVDYLPACSEVYKEWLSRQPARLDWDRWVMMGLIGFTVGVIGFLLHQLIHMIADIKWEYARIYLRKNILIGWVWVLGYSLIFTSASAASVAFFYPYAGGSGIPEIVGFLNGTRVRHVLNLKALVVKFFSCFAAVGAGLPVGPEGPMIHMGGIIGTGISQFRSLTLKISFPIFARFRNPEDRRNFTSAGTAAGVAAAFGAPVGGLLFAMEEVSSFWSMKLSWMTFFCCMIATFTADLFNSAFEGFKYVGNFGLFMTDKYIIFKLQNSIPVNVIMFLPAVCLGLIGGILGAVFTSMNLKVSRARRRLIAQIKNSKLQRIVRFLEPQIIMIIMASFTVFIPSAFSCKPIMCPNGNHSIVNHQSPNHHSHYMARSWVERVAHHYGIHSGDHGDHHDDEEEVEEEVAEVYEATNVHPEELLVQRMEGEHKSTPHAAPPASPHHPHPPPPTSPYTSSTDYIKEPAAHATPMTKTNRVFCFNNPDWPLNVEPDVKHYTCRKTNFVNNTIYWGEYNEIATLLNAPGQSALRQLYSRNTHLQFDYAPLLTILPVYFVLACWAAGSAISSGIVVPMLMIGGLYGRVIGRIITDMYGGIPRDPYWEWIDPGAFALIGSASFFGGVSRLTMSLTVIMIEITNDVQFLLPIMVSIMVAKLVGDSITHPLYHSLLEMKCIPFLDTEPIVYDDRHKVLNLELFKAKDVMRFPVITLHIIEPAAHLAHILVDTTHAGFPIVRRDEYTGLQVQHGLLSRMELCVILSDEAVYKEDRRGATVTPRISYEDVSTDRLENPELVDQLLEKYLEESIYKEIYVNLEPYFNKSAPSVEENFSLHRTYILFRTLGLRHLTVVDVTNQVVGMITRKDLMGFNLEEKLEERKRRGTSFKRSDTRPKNTSSSQEFSPATPTAV